VLIVDDTPEVMESLAESIRDEARVVLPRSFDEARARLLASPPDLLVVNLRLGAYNGLHLVHLAIASGFHTRSIVYTDAYDAGFAHDTKDAGAFYETLRRLRRALVAYNRAALPDADRRAVSFADRRQAFRGGRRITDVSRID
jgi:DNA-binding NtrC family response regulator